MQPHRMMIEDWEAGALYWNLVDKGAEPKEAARKVKDKFLMEICGLDKDTPFFVGTLARHSKAWVVIGIFYPKQRHNKVTKRPLGPLFKGL